MGLTLGCEKGQAQTATPRVLAASALVVVIMRPLFLPPLTDYLFAYNLWDHNQFRDFQTLS